MNNQLRNPFQHQPLPWLATLHRHAFRSGKREVWEPVKFASRVGFYIGHSIWPWPVMGTAEVDVGESTRSFRFDARNRMFSAVYFDQFSAGYEPPVMALIDALMPDDGVFFDIGSNWGYYSVYLAARPGFRGRIHAFEPWPQTFHDLTSTVAQLNFAESITCHNIALGAAEQTGNMRCGSHSGNAHICHGNGGVKLPIRPLDELDVPTPHILKVDTEGHEEAVFRGARRTLTKSRPMIVFEHRYELDLAEQRMRGSLEYLESLDYRLFLPRFNGRSHHVDPRDGNGADAKSFLDDGVRLRDCNSKTRGESREIPDLFACPVDKFEELRGRNWIDA